MYRVKIKYYDEQGRYLHGIYNEKFWTITQAHRYAKDRLDENVSYKLSFQKGYERFLLKRFRIISLMCEILFLPIGLASFFLGVFGFFVEFLRVILKDSQDYLSSFFPKFLSKTFKWNEVALKQMETK